VYAIQVNNQASSTGANTIACDGNGTIQLGPFSLNILVYIGGQWTL
jgi:hypothetical protein